MTINYSLFSLRHDFWTTIEIDKDDVFGSFFEEAGALEPPVGADALRPMGDKAYILYVEGRPVAVLIESDAYDADKKAWAHLWHYSEDDLVRARCSSCGKYYTDTGANIEMNQGTFCDDHC